MGVKVGVASRVAVLVLVGVSLDRGVEVGVKVGVGSRVEVGVASR